MKEKLKFKLGNNSRFWRLRNYMVVFILSSALLFFVLATILEYFCNIFDYLFKLDIIGFLGSLIGFFLCVVYIYAYVRFWLEHKELTEDEINEIKKQNKNRDENQLRLQTQRGTICLNNPYRGIFIMGSAGSGKSESIAVPLLKEFINKKFSGVVYDFKYPTLANDINFFLSLS